LPLLYQFPMPSRFVDRYPLARYEDIWAGYVAQGLVAVHDDAMTAGRPVVRHAKQGALHKELAGEHYGTLLSPAIFDVVDEALTKVARGPYLEMFAQLADCALSTGPLAAANRAVPAPFRDYLDQTFRAVMRWCALHAHSGTGRVRAERMSGA
jgi:hypothetical protein